MRNNYRHSSKAENAMIGNPPQARLKDCSIVAITPEKNIHRFLHMQLQQNTTMAKIMCVSLVSQEAACKMRENTEAYIDHSRGMYTSRQVTTTWARPKQGFTHALHFHTGVGVDACTCVLQ